jgi:hypothetical protein
MKERKKGESLPSEACSVVPQTKTKCGDRTANRHSMKIVSKHVYNTTAYKHEKNRTVPAIQHGVTKSRPSSAHETISRARGDISSVYHTVQRATHDGLFSALQ